MTAGTRLILVFVGLLLPGWPLATGQEMVPYDIAGQSIPDPLTDERGNPVRGRQIIRDVDNATCLICHSIPIPDEPDQGNIGPSLAGVGSRYSEGELRLRIVNSKAINPDTVMPAYYRIDGLNRVMGLYVGRPIYSAQQVEDVVAYLTSLKDRD